LWTSIPIVRDGAAFGRLGLVRDVTRERSAERSLKQLQSRLQDLTPVDALTGLPNMRRFREELDREHTRSARAWDSYAVLRVDVDGMQGINDELGTPIGDEVLEQIGDRLKRCRREYDVVARHDADEFIVLLPGADRVAAEAVAMRMQKSIGAHDFGLADSRAVTVSVGGCVWIPPSAESSEDILRRAGDSLARARGEGARQIRIDASAASGSNPPAKR
jgi:diguanylate cyclase (GGDEF)-like protein